MLLFQVCITHVYTEGPAGHTYDITVELLLSSYREGYVEVAKILLEAGSDVETPDNYGQSPLFMACWKGTEKLNIHTYMHTLLPRHGKY